MKESQLGIIGMGVMGKSLALNALDKGLSVSVYNRDTLAEKEVIPDFQTQANHPALQGFTNLEAFVNSLQKPRKILLMVTAGNAVDGVLGNLTSLLSKGDILMEGGNSYYRDTQRREKHMQSKEVHYLGIGISGGEAGALNGPSLMAGGNMEAYELVKPLLEKIAAKDTNLQPCVSLLGPNGAGHFVKTIHNGIEYAEMQLLAEVYALLRPSLSQEEIYEVLLSWNEGPTSSFLLETTLGILQTKEEDAFLLPKVLDVAKSKGTGTWSGEAALRYGVPATLLIQAVMARAVSNRKDLRVSLEEKLDDTPFEATVDTEKLKMAYQFARILNHAQGMELISETSKEEKWNINLFEVTRVWSNGCILRSQLIEELTAILQKQPSLLEASKIYTSLVQWEGAVNETLIASMEQRTPLPCMSSALQYWYGMTTANSSANLIQAQRDAFGAHTFQRNDRPSSDFFTSSWNLNG